MVWLTGCGWVNRSTISPTASMEYVPVSTATVAPISTSTTAPLPITGVTSIAAGTFHTCALTFRGGVMCWGDNGGGQLGRFTATYTSRYPVDARAFSSGVKAIAAGFGYTCALTVDGGVQCWGIDYLGNSGNLTPTYGPIPWNVNGLSSGVVSIAAGSFHTCVLTTGGGVKCWGWNTHGQLGDGTTADSDHPVDVKGLSNGVVAIAAGGFYTCALTQVGGVKCWGRNSYGELGNGTTADSGIPLGVTGLSEGVVAISAGVYHACALTSTDP